MPKWKVRAICGASATATAASAGARATAPHPAAPQGNAMKSPPLQRTTNADLLEMVGDAKETQQEHLERHGGGRRSCPRCRFYRFAAKWAQGHGFMNPADRLAEPERVKHLCIQWVAERPARWGGAWGLGCVLCAAQVSRLAKEQKADAHPAVPQGNRRRLGTRWSRYEVRNWALSASHLRKHGVGDNHRLAELAWLQPDAPVQLQLQANLQDDALLRGSVPQGEDWLRAWRASRTPQSWEAAANTLKTEHYIHANHQRSATAKAIMRMVRVMREAVRRHKRAALKQAVSISLAFDDRAGYKLVVFRAVHHALLKPGSAAPQGDAAHASKFEVTEGIAGCFQVLHGSSLEDFADDYAIKAGQEVLQVLSRLCTPLGEEFDAELYSHVLSSVHSITADGALQKTGTLLRASLPNLRMVARDPAHCIRIAVQQPMVRSDHFQKQHAMLFTDRHALLKGIQFSHALQARLEACQKLVLEHRGSQGGGLQKVMRHFGFAAHRFESWTNPRRRYACAIHAMALLLAEMAGDTRRKKDERQRAETALAAMTPQNLFEVGLACDYGEISMRL